MGVGEPDQENKRNNILLMTKKNLKHKAKDYTVTNIVIISLVVITTASFSIFSYYKNSLASANYEPAKQTLESGLVTITFDDGWLSVYENAMPILNEKSYKSSIYIASDVIAPHWNRVSKKQILKMESWGHEIGSHTKSHKPLADMTVNKMKKEIVGSKEDLLDLGVKSVDTFAYPFGDYNNFTDQIVHEAGYLGARTSDWGFNSTASDPYILKIKSVKSGTSFAQAQDWINEAIATDTWLILAFHRINNDGSEYSTTPEDFKKIVNYLAERKIRVVTTTEGIQLLALSE